MRFSSKWERNEGGGEKLCRSPITASLSTHIALPKKSGVMLSTLLWKLSFVNQDTTHASLEDHKSLPLASTCVARANLFSLLVYPGAHFSLLVYRSAHIYFSLNFGSLILNYFILAEFIFHFQNWASTKHQVLPWYHRSSYITNKKTRYVQS